MNTPLSPPGAPSAPDGFRQALSLASLVVAIVAVNAFTLWFLTRPPRTALPKLTALDPVPAERLLTSVAGVYETGAAPGDRRLEIRKEGEAHRFRFGPNRTPTKPQTFTVQAVSAAGQPALVTNNRSLIAIKDPGSVVLFGDTYRRVTR